MVLAENRAKCLSLVNYTSKAIHHHLHHHHHHLGDHNLYPSYLISFSKIGQSGIIVHQPTIQSLMVEQSLQLNH